MTFTHKSSFAVNLAQLNNDKGLKESSAVDTQQKPEIEFCCGHVVMMFKRTIWRLKIAMRQCTKWKLVVCQRKRLTAKKPVQNATKKTPVANGASTTSSSDSESDSESEAEKTTKPKAKPAVNGAKATKPASTSSSEASSSSGEESAEDEADAEDDSSSDEEEEPRVNVLVLFPYGLLQKCANLFKTPSLQTIVTFVLLQKKEVFSKTRVVLLDPVRVWYLFKPDT